MKPKIAFAVLLFALTGCVFERRTIVVDIPKKTKTIEILLINEGCSQPNYLRESPLIDADFPIRYVKHFQKTHTSLSLVFFDEPVVFGTMADPNVTKELVKFEKEQFHFDGWKFYIDPSRKRKLCCYQKITVPYRNKLAMRLNFELSRFLRKEQKRFKDKKERENSREQVKSLRKDLVNWWKDEKVDVPGVKYLAAMFEVLGDLDDESANSLIKAANNSYQWIQVQPGLISVHFPVTQDCAIRLKKNHEAFLRNLFIKSDLILAEANGKGLFVKLGTGKTTSVQLIMPNATKVDARFDAGLIKAVRNPKIQTSAQRLIKQFLNRRSGKGSN